MKRTIIFIIIGFLFISIAHAQVTNQQGVKFKIQRKHALQVMVPEGWRVEGDQELKKGVLTVTFGPAAGQSFKFIVSGSIVGKGDDAPLRSAEEMKLILKLSGLKALKSAVESNLTIREAPGRQGGGYYYSMTDKRDPLPDGDFRYVWQGIFAIGEIRATATLLSDSSDEVLRITALKLLQTAEDVKP
jgi:hypothetical protein